MGFDRNSRIVKAGLIGAGLGLALAGLGGCASAGKALGMAKITPDEFRVVARAPLTVPPDYSLRPPRPGEPRPQELEPESQARTALLGASAGVQRSQGEQLLVAKAGVAQADPLIRYVVDDEFGDVAHKDRGFADKVLGWTGVTGGDSAGASNTGANDPAPLNPTPAEDLTGGGQVIISRGGGGVKLPGL